MGGGFPVVLFLKKNPIFAEVLIYHEILHWQGLHVAKDVMNTKIAAALRYRTKIGMMIEWPPTYK